MKILYDDILPVVLDVYVLYCGDHLLQGIPAEVGGTPWSVLTNTSYSSCHELTTHGKKCLILITFSPGEEGGSMG